MIPEFLNESNVLGIGEIGLNKNTKNESTIFLEHVDLAVRYNQQILIHTPHLEDKFQGTKMIVDMLVHDTRVDRSRVLVDHVEEHTIQEVLDQGFWAGMTLYPVTKCTPARAADMIERFGPERLMANSAGDWGPSKPTAIPDLIMELKRRGHSRELIRRVVYENPCKFFSQSKNFKAPLGSS
jgi:predicted metal-dependent TIM-barrel fold hydrolase